MSNISIIDTPLLFTSIIAGFIASIILFYPIVSYGKEFGRMQQTGKTYAEIIGKTIVMQLAITLFFIALSWFWNVAVGQNDRSKSYSIRYGTALFFGHFNPDTGAFTKPNYNQNEGFWTMWNNLAENKARQVLNQTDDTTMSAGTRKVIAGGIILISIGNVLIWLLLLMIPPFFCFAPYIMMTRKTSQEPEGRTILNKAYMYAILTVAFVFISYVHLLIAEAYINTQIIGADFSYFKNVQAIWREIFEVSGAKQK